MVSVRDDIKNLRDDDLPSTDWDIHQILVISLSCLSGKRGHINRESQRRRMKK
jgi:hypothetical protein